MAQTSIHPTSARRSECIIVNSESTVYTKEHITATYVDRGATVAEVDGKYTITPLVESYMLQTARNVGKTGFMMVGIGGNNGTTLCATVLANRHNITWRTKSGIQTPNYIGSLVRASTVRIGNSGSTGKDVHIPVSDILPMIHPNDIVLGGWDISGVAMDKAMERAAVLDYDLQRQVAPFMAEMGKPLPSLYYPDFIASNQEERADNVVSGHDKQDHLDHIRADIRAFKRKHNLDRVVVFWSANTERNADIIPGVNDTADTILAAIRSSHSEISQSTVFAIASILEGEPFVNGAPQNTFVPGVIELAERHKSFIGGDDIKSGQTKLKSVFFEFLVNAGMKPLSIASYNHLGNNDGFNLSSERQFKSKEVCKSTVIDDMVEANRLLYRAPENMTKDKGEHPDHVVVIKYVPAVGDSKRAIDEYNSEIFCGGRSTINILNTCEDSLLATPLMLDVVILTELITRVRCKRSADDHAGFEPLHPALSLLSYLLKGPVVKPGTEVVHSLNRQRGAIEQFLKACIGLSDSGSDLSLASRVW